MPLCCSDAPSFSSFVQLDLIIAAGMIRQILVDDKGTVLIGAFGVPPFSHTDDPLRAVRAALSIKEMLFKLGIICSIGVTYVTCCLQLLC